MNSRVVKLLAVIDLCEDPSVLMESIAVAIEENSSALFLRTFERINMILESVRVGRPKSLRKVVRKLFPQLSVITVAMKQFAAIAAAQEAILALVSSVLTSASVPGIADEFCACGICDGLLSALKTHSTMSNLCTKALYVCKSLVESHSENQMTLGTRECGDAVAAVVRAHMEDVNILSEAAHLVLALCASSPPILDVLGDTCIVEAFIECLALQEPKAATYKPLLEAIMCLCHDKNQTRFGTATTFDTLVNALRWNRTSEDIFKELCRAIIQICGMNEDIKAAIPGALFADVMNDIFHDSEVSETTLKLAVMLMYFTASNDSHRNDLLEKGLGGALAALHARVNPSLAKTIASCRRRLNGTRVLDSSLGSDLSPDTRSESQQEDSVPKRVSSSTHVAEEPPWSPLAEGRAAPHASPLAEVRIKSHGVPDDSDTQASLLHDDRTPTEKVRSSVEKMIGAKRQNLQKLGMVSLMQGMDKIYDPAVMTEIYKTSVQMNNRDMCLKALQRTDDIIKEAKAAKTYSPLVTFVIADPTRLLALLQHFIQDPEIQSVGLLVITRMSYAGGGVESFGSTECFRYLYDVMSTWGTNRDVILLILALTGRLTAKNQENKLRASQHGAFRTVVTCMRHFRNDTTVLDKLCRYVFVCVDKAPQNSEAFREAGGCDLLMTLMISQFESGGDVADTLNVTVLSVCSQNASNQIFFTSSGCMSLYFKEMAKAISSASAAKFKFPSMLILGMLKFPDVSVAALLKCKAPAKLLTILRATAVKDILEMAVVLIQAMCRYESLNSKFSELGIVDALTKLTEGGNFSDLQKSCDAIVASVTGASTVMSSSPEAVEYNAQRRKV